MNLESHRRRQHYRRRNFYTPTVITESSVNFAIFRFSPTIHHFASVYQKLADDNLHSDGEFFISPTIPRIDCEMFFSPSQMSFQRRILPSVVDYNQSHHSLKRIKATPRECSWPTFIFGTETCVYNNTAVTPCTFHR